MIPKTERDADAAILAAATGGTWITVPRTSQEGLMVMSKSLPTDGLTPDVTAGLRQWSERGYQLTHGHGGFGFFGLPLPWGDRPAIDAYLTACGHRP